MTTPTSNEYLGTEQSPDYIPTGDERTMAILVHVLSIFFWIIPALIIYLIKKDESKFVAYHAKEQLNFQITMTIVYAIMIITIVGLLFIWIPGIVALVLCIVAAIKASDLKLYKFPLTIRLIK
jgi:uncharacterized Tic20 family protein